MTAESKVPEWARARVIITDSGCWEWTGWRHAGGYGGCQRAGHNMAHRVMYSELVGPIPPGLDLDHLCRNRPCCNPAHLEPVTRSENLFRGVRSWREACEHGHVGRWSTRTRQGGRRRCLECHRLRENARYQARRVA